MQLNFNLTHPVPSKMGTVIQMMALYIIWIKMLEPGGKL